MALKPILNPPQWALPGNYTTGPFIGFPRRIPIAVGVANEGHRPGSNFPTTAEEWNDWLAMVGDLARWAFFGSFLPLAEPRIVETDEKGYLFSQKGVFHASDSPGEPGVEATANGGAAVEAHASSPIETGFVFDDVGAAGFWRSSGAPFTCFVLNSGTGNAILASASGNHAIQAGSNATHAGIHGDGFADIPGVHGESANNINGVGVVGTATNPSATGVRGESDAGGDSFGAGLRGVGRGDAPAIVAEPEDGYGLVVGIGNSFLPPLRISTNVSNPVVQGGDGSVWYNNTQKRFGEVRNGTRMFRWSSPAGSVMAASGVGQQAGAIVFAGGFVSFVAANTKGDHSPAAPVGTVLIRVALEWSTLGVLANLLLRVDDSSNAVVAYGPATFLNDGNTGTRQGTVFLEFEYNLASAGPTQFDLLLDAAGPSVLVRNVCLTVVGAYN